MMLKTVSRAHSPSTKKGLTPDPQKWYLPQSPRYQPSRGRISEEVGEMPLKRMSALSVCIIFTAVLLFLQLHLSVPAQDEKKQLDTFDFSMQINRLIKEKQYDKALQMVGERIKQEPKNTDWWQLKGNIYSSRGEYELAITCYKKALEINPKDEVSWINIASALDKQGKYEEVLKIRDDFIRRKPDNSYVWGNKGDTLLKMKRYDEAAKCYDKALELSKENLTAWYGRGEVYYQTKKYADAITCYDRLLKIAPNYKSAIKRRQEAEKALKSGK